MTETGEKVVSYVQLYGNFLRCARSPENFTEHVVRPDWNYEGPRFVLVEELDIFNRSQLIELAQRYAIP